MPTSVSFAPYRRKPIAPEPAPEPPDYNPDWYETFDSNRGLAIPAQQHDWTCSACATQWTLHATGLDPNITRPQTIWRIGYPEQINPSVGLTNRDGPGEALIDVFELYGVNALQGWLDFDTVYDLTQGTAIVMSGSNWYHWVAVRGIDGPNLWIANSAPGYKGVYSSLSRSQFNSLGPMNVVYLER